MTKAKPVSALSSPSWLLISLFLFLFQISSVAFAKKGGEPADQPPSEQPNTQTACSVSQPSQVTALTLLPSDSVTPGTEVTVRIDGYGCCYVALETNGASDHDGGAFGDYTLEFGPFPKSQKFTANTEGNFKIAIIAVDAENKSCLENDAFAINTTLYVGYEEPQMPEMKPKKKIPLIPKTQPQLTPRGE
jgi:hypothetical protein